MAKKPQTENEPAHKATYASDKYNPGQYNIRVIGPHAAKFSGRVVPVTRKDDSTSEETLGKCFWSGVDKDTGRPVALYHFEAKPRDEELDDEIPF